VSFGGKLEETLAIFVAFVCCIEKKNIKNNFLNKKILSINKILKIMYTEKFRPKKFLNVMHKIEKLKISK